MELSQAHASEKADNPQAASSPSSDVEFAKYLKLTRSGYLSGIIKQRDHNTEFAASELLVGNGEAHGAETQHSRGESDCLLWFAPPVRRSQQSSGRQVVPAVEDLCETCRPFLCVSRLRVTMCRKLPSCIGSPYCARPSIEIDTPAMKSSEIQTSSVLRCNPLRSLLLYLVPEALLGESVGMFFVQGPVKNACKVVSCKNRSI
jgi:hypothetical protein